MNFLLPRTIPPLGGQGGKKRQELNTLGGQGGKKMKSIDRTLRQAQGEGTKVGRKDAK